MGAVSRLLLAARFLSRRNVTPWPTRSEARRRNGMEGGVFRYAFRSAVRCMLSSAEVLNHCP